MSESFFRVFLFFRTIAIMIDFIKFKIIIRTNWQDDFFPLITNTCTIIIIIISPLCFGFHDSFDTDSSVLIAFKPEKIEYSNIILSIICLYKVDVLVFLHHYKFSSLNSSSYFLNIKKWESDESGAKGHVVWRASISFFKVQLSRFQMISLQSNALLKWPSTM